LLGLIALEQGATADAIITLRAAAQSVPDSAQYQGHLGIAIRQTGVLSAEPDDLLTPPTEVSALGEARSALERATLLAWGNLEPLVAGEVLAPAAIEAVKQWKYKPYLLNGEPVEVETTVEVHFNLSGG
jgi:hypothetical protein